MSGDGEAALDLLETIVITVWPSYGAGRYRATSALDRDTAQLLADCRPDRWERTPEGLARP